jgi:phosphoribosyl-AMP cyclohydrolase
MDVQPRFDESGLLPAVVQDAATGQVLMLAFMNLEAFELTRATGETHFWSRSRKELWHKGATSGNIQRVVEMALDCDLDALLVRVQPAGPACHTGAVSCFFNNLIGKVTEF